MSIEKLLKLAEEKKKAQENKPKLEIVLAAENEDTSPPEIGQPVNQNSVNQLTSVVNQNNPGAVNQIEDLLDNQLTTKQENLVNQNYNENLFRSRTQRKLKGIRLPIQKLSKYETWCFANKVDFQDAVETALDWLTSQPNPNIFGQPVNHILIDDLDEVKETDEILIFYQKWTGNKIKTKDRSAREEVRGFSDDACKAGILTAIMRAKQKINSFAYCVKVIEEVAEELKSVPSKDAYLSYLEKFVLSAQKGK